MIDAGKVVTFPASELHKPTYRLQCMSRKTKGDSPAAPKPEPLWNDRAGTGGRKQAIGVRWTLTILAIIALLAAIFRGFFMPVNKTIINEAPKTSVSSVGEYAAAFVTDWFTWDENDADDRQSRLMVYNAALANTGWDKRGAQNVTDARVFNSEDQPGGQHLVTVRVTVDTTPAAFYVEVLAAEVDGAFAVMSIPTLVPAPLLAEIELPPSEFIAERDPQVVEAARERAEHFFATWATGDPLLSGFIAEGVTIPPLGGGITLNRVTEFSMPAAAEGAPGGKRSVAVSLVWNWPNGQGQTPATYTVDMSLEAGKWYVSGLRAGVPTPLIIPGGGIPDAAEPTPSPSADTSSQGQSPEAVDSNIAVAVPPPTEELVDG